MKNAGSCKKYNFFVILFCIFEFLPTRGLHAQFNQGLTAPSSEQQKGFRFGKWSLHPTFGYFNAYDSNALFSDQSPEGDFFMDVSAGAEVMFEGTRLNALTGYRYKFINYFQTNVQDYDAQSIFFRGAYNFSRRLILRLNEQFDITSDPADAELLERVGRTMNQASVELVHQTPAQDLQTSFKYTNTYQSFDTQFLGLGYYGNKFFLSSRINLSSRFRFLPKSTLLVNGEYGFTRFNDNDGLPPKNSNSQGWSTSVGLNSQFSRKLDLLAQFGLSSLYFDDGNNALSTLGVFTAGYRMSEKIHLSAGYQRRLEISQFTNYFTDNTFELKLDATMSRKLDLNTRAAFSLIDFSGPNVIPTGQERSDKVYQIQMNMFYKLKSWLKPKLTYQYLYRDSNSTSFVTNNQSADFSKHIVGIGVDLYY